MMSFPNQPEETKPNVKTYIYTLRSFSQLNFKVRCADQRKPRSGQHTETASLICPSQSALSKGTEDKRDVLMKTLLLAREGRYTARALLRIIYTPYKHT